MTLDSICDKLVFWGSPNRVVDQILAFREEVGDFGTLLYAGKDWKDPALGKLTLAKEAGIFAKNGLDVTIKKIPQKDRHLAIASGDIQCAATTVETWIVWNANGVATTQLFQMDQGFGADGMVVRNDIASIKDLKGKTVAASAPGTAPYFTLAWFLKKNGMSLKDVTVVNMEPGPAAQAFVAGQNDAADDLRALSLGRCATSPSPARSSPPRSTIRW